MQLEHSFTVPVGINDAWAVLLDIERIAPCMPGAAIDSVDGDDFTGTVKVKLGPIGLTYKGKASFVEKDVDTHRAVIDARGRDSRGNGTASAKVTATLTEAGEATEVKVVTDLDITGKPAQFGRGVMVDVGNKLIGQFADCLAGKLSAGAAVDDGASPDESGHVGAHARPAAASDTASTADTATIKTPDAANEAQAETAPAAPTTATPSPRPAPRPSVDVQPINLIESAGPAVAKRLAPVAAAVVLLLVFLRWRRSR
jgi:uncharacterized protein